MSLLVRFRWPFGYQVAVVESTGWRWVGLVALLYCTLSSHCAHSIRTYDS